MFWGGRDCNQIRTDINQRFNGTRYEKDGLRVVCIIRSERVVTAGSESLLPTPYGLMDMMKGHTLITIHAIKVDENISARQILGKFDTILRSEAVSFVDNTLRSSAAEYPTGIARATCAAI
jgi:hypothetical protein